MSLNKDPLAFDQQWAVAVKAVNRRTGDGRARRLFADKELARVIATCIEETSLPQVHTLGWLCNVLVRLSRDPRRYQLEELRLAAAGRPQKRPLRTFTHQEVKKILRAAFKHVEPQNEREKRERVRYAVFIDEVIDAALAALQGGSGEQLEQVLELLDEIKSSLKRRTKINAFRDAMLAEIGNLQVTEAARRRVEVIVKKYFG
jgi:hypothetical protein